MSENFEGENNKQQVVVAVTRTIKPGFETDDENWVKKISSTAATFEGYLGANVHRPAKGNFQYTTVYRFDDHNHAAAWQSSDIHKQLTSEIKDWVEDSTQRQIMTGLEVWFDTPGSAQKAPIKWKMAVVLFVVVYVLVNFFSAIVAMVAGELPRLLQMAIVIGVQVLLMTYFLMPKLNIWLKKWLFN